MTDTHAADAAASASDQPVHVVLVPGFWLGAWAWDEVAQHLRDGGVVPVTLTLPGLESPDADRASVGLEDHVRAVEEALATVPEGARTILVAHSGGAVPATVALDRHVQQVDHTVWVDTAPVVDGFVMAEEAEGTEHPLSAQWDEEYDQGAMEGLSEEQLATFQERAVPQPTGTMTQPAVLTDPERLHVPGTVICTAFDADSYRSYAQQGLPFLAGLLEFTHLHLVDLPTGHWPMWSRPADLADIILDVARES